MHDKKCLALISAKHYKKKGQWENNVCQLPGLDQKEPEKRREKCNAGKQTPLNYQMVPREKDFQEQNQIIWLKHLRTKSKGKLPRTAEHWARGKGALQTNMDRWGHDEEESIDRQRKTRVDYIQRKSISEGGEWSI